MQRGRVKQGALALACVVAVGLAASVSQVRAEIAAALRVLDVPFVPQTPALCGGAAVAMVMRFWGEPGILAKDFTTLVGKDGDGISTVDLEAALRQRGWRAISFTGGLEEARAQLDRRRPIVALVREPHGANHYVVIVGASADRVLMHDPSRGPFRVVDAAPFEARWREAGNWGLLVLPPEGAASDSTPSKALPSEANAEAAPEAHDDCALLVSHGVRLARAGELEAAEELLQAAHRLWPATAAPLYELAGLRFHQKRWGEAEELAEQAARLEPRGTYAWELLGTTRFVRGDANSALAAWNHVQQPRIDVARVDGLQRTRHDVVTRLLDLPSGALLTEASLRRSRRRLEALPSRSSARLSYLPLPNGMAQVQINVHEQPLWSAGAPTLPWAFAHALVDRELRIASAAPTGNGELWSARWRWWENRPAIGFGVAMPSAPGIWRVDALWERQAVRATEGSQVVQMERRRTAAGCGQWATADLHWDVGAALEGWPNRGHDAVFECALEQRAANDRLALRMIASRGWNTEGLAPYATGGLLAKWRSSASADAPALRLSLRAGIAVSSSNAPLLLWPGAGNDPGDPVLLRAHSRFEDGVLTGKGLGREVAHGGMEVQLWPWRTNVVQLGVATFVDIARPRGALVEERMVTQADFGAGLRLRVASQPECLRLDFARAASNGQMAISLGFESTWSLGN